MIEQIKDIIHNPSGLITALGKRKVLNWMSDEAFAKLLYRVGIGKKLDLDNPQTYNEKLQWLKLYDRKDIYTSMVDKYEVRKYIADRIGEEYLIPLVGGPWDSFDEINFDALPEQFVLKCTHDSGGVVICKDKSKLDMKACKKKIERHLKINFYWAAREWPYKNVKPRIIAEKYMEDSTTSELRDYKFYAFDGEPKTLFVASGRQSTGDETKFDFFDMEYNHLDIRKGHPNADVYPDCPKNFEKMKHLAALLSKGIPHVRVDFYEVDEVLYFGELTLFSGAGAGKFEPEEWDKTFGNWIKLPKC